MKKFFTLFLSFCLIFLITACKESEGTFSDNSLSSHKKMTSYKKFLNELKNKQDDLYYYIKDIDRNNIDDLLVLENTKLSVYTYENSIELIGEQDFLTGTVRFFSSENINYPGIFYFTVGGGINHYGYMTIKDKNLSFENLWEENFATESQNNVNHIKELSSNKDLISESKALFDKNLDIKFVSLKQ